MDMQAIEHRLRDELEATEKRLRTWHDWGRPIVAGHTLHRLVDFAQQAAAVETHYADAGRLTERARRLRMALGRLHDGGYGVCEDCEAGIVPARLMAIPDTQLCLACQLARERAATREDHGARDPRGDRLPPHSRRRHAPDGTEPEPTSEPARKERRQ